jgi:hypothetical protein
MASPHTQLNQAAIRGASEAEQHLAALERAYMRALRAAGLRAARSFEAAAHSLTAAADPKWTPPPTSQIFNTQQLADDTQQKTAKLHRQILDAAGTAALEPFGIVFDVAAPVPQALLDKVGQRVQSGIADAIQAQITDAIQDGYKEGHSVATVAAAIRSKTSEIAKPRAEMLARTDLNALANGGSLAAASLAGAAPFKTWTTAEDDRVRDTHQEADGQTVPIDAPFTVGGEEAQYPGDPDLSDEEACNCRCTITYTDSLAAAAAAPVSPTQMLLAHLAESRAVAARAEMETLGVLGRMLEASAMPQPAPTIHVHVPPQEAPVVNVTVPAQEPAKVEVNMPPIELAPIVVNVPAQPAPQVHVAAATPPDVHVHVPEQPVVAAAPPAPVVGVRVETDKRGNKTYIPIREED